MPRLIPPDPDLHAELLTAYEEFAGAHVDGGGMEGSTVGGTVGGLIDGGSIDGSGMYSTTSELLHDPAGFATWVKSRRREADPAIEPPPGRVRCSYFWIVEDSDVLGFLAIRHELNDFLRRLGGHIGYSVRPSARRRGVASGALREALPIARSLGITRALLTCEETNLGSRRTIEGNGGVYENSVGTTRRYWIDLT